MSPLVITGPAAGRSDVRLSCIAARDAGKAEAFAARHGFLRAAADYGEAIAAPDIDLVYIALPATAHARWALRAVEAGKHVLCEKPFAAHIDDAQAVLDIARRRDRRVIEALHTRYHPLYEALLGAVAAGTLGRVHSVDVEINAPIPAPSEGEAADIRRLPETGGGAMADLGCYAIAFALDLFGTLPRGVEAAAWGVVQGVDEEMQALLHFDLEGAAAGQRSGRARLSCSIDPHMPFSSRLSVNGTKGRAVYDAPLTPEKGAGLTILTEEGRTSLPPPSLPTYHYQLDAVLHGLATGSPLPTEGEDILDRQRILDAVYEAAGLSALRAGPSLSECSP